ncbi:MAG: tetratricopeptide repeat protein [Acidobacteria bacterium]|nr:tetratricopeptide repeat protein [Acidobacteriota bacterium]
MKTKISIVLMLLGLCLVGGACRKKPAPTTPAPPQFFPEAEQYFEAGDYARAAEAYEAYLRLNPSPANHDKALFRLALAYAFPDSPVHHWERAVELFKRVVSLFPQSPYKQQAELILYLQAEVDRLRLEINDRESQMKLQQSELDQLKKNLGELQLKLGEQEGQISHSKAEQERLRREVDRLRSEVKEREDRLQALKDELERLKRIDLQRRPPRPSS